MRLSILLCVLVTLVGTHVHAQRTQSTDVNLVGFAKTDGGKGGKVIKVTTLDGAGPGSLREALETEGPRIIVFEVGGVIDLNKERLTITHPSLTLAGQTAPSPGITIIRGGISVQTHDVIIQHIRVRPGDVGDPKKSGWEPDALSTAGANAYNIIVDHCSFSWATDENLSASGPRLEGPKATSRRITFSNNIIAECLSDSTHAKGEHSKGTLVHDFCREIAVMGNLYAHNLDRNPYFKAHTTGVIVNNMIYNPGRNAIQLGFWGKEWQGSKYKPKNARVSVVGNVFRHGPDTKRNLPLVNDKGDAFIQDNLAVDTKDKPVPMKSKRIKELKEKPVWPEGLKPMPASAVLDYVVKNAGARPKDRDAIDQRIIKELLERKGKIIDSQEEVGGYPKYKKTTRKLNVPKTNVQAWLDQMASELEK